MIETGQVWTSGGRAVQVLATNDGGVTVRDTYGWRRSLTQEELTNGFTERVERVRGVMARRSLADVEPA